MRRALALGIALALPLTVPAASAQEAAGLDRAAVTAAYERGLAWLRKDAKDGKFGAQGKADPGLTALGLIALLHRPGGPAKEDAALIDSCAKYLVSCQKPDGGIYIDRVGNYNTSLAIQALKATGKAEYDEVVKKAAGYVRAGQFAETAGEHAKKVDPSDQRYGGIGYGSDPTQPDMSNTQFALESLRAAGVPETDPAFQRALTYLQRSQNRKENESGPSEPKRWEKDGAVIVRANDGGSNYRPGDSKAGTKTLPDGTQELRSYGSMTYALLKCYLFAGLPADDPRVADAVKWIGANYTWKTNPGFTEEGQQEGLQGLYYYYATGARALAMLGDGRGPVGSDGKPRPWRRDLSATLLGAQREDGSWVNENGRWMEGLPIIPTSFALQALADCLK